MFSVAAVLGSACLLLFSIQVESTCISQKYEPFAADGHTACLAPPATTPTQTGLSDTDRQLILNKHNTYRAVPNAVNMQKMAWDEEIEAVAQKWADNCDFSHDSLRFIPGRFSVGQNLALGYRTWEAAIDGWYNEVNDFVYDSTSQSFSAVGHYTQMVWHDSAKLGCGFARCPSLGDSPFYVCNYGSGGNNPFYHPYDAGAKCGSCPNSCRDNLCDCGGKVCQNGGTLNVDTCECSCKHPWHYGAECYLNCTSTDQHFACGSTWTSDLCFTYTNLPDDCPHLCNICPYGAGPSGATPVPPAIGGSSAPPSAGAPSDSSTTTDSSAGGSTGAVAPTALTWLVGSILASLICS